MHCDVTIVNRIKRARGQLDGILKMIEEGRGCEDLSMQLKAVQNSIKRAVRILTVNNLVQKIEKEHNIKIDSFDKEIDLIINT